MRILLLLLGHAWFVAVTSLAGKNPPSLVPSDSRIQYTGRIDHSNPQLAQFSWVMTGAACSVNLTRAHATVSAYFIAPKDGARLRVMIDGAFSGFVDVMPEPDGNQRTVLYGLGSVSNSGMHTLEFFKVTEDNTRKGNQGVMGFGGFTILSGGTFGPRPVTAIRRLEFIGDSDTAGWCADGNTSGEDKPDKYQDGYQTWAMQLARKVSAEFMIEAVSGFGVEPSTPAIQPVMDYTLGFDTDGGKWNYTSWIPDAVVILIGPNDEGVSVMGGGSHRRHGNFSDSEFVKAYLQLLTRVAKRYKGVKVPPKVVHVCGGSLNGLDPCDDIQTANRQFNEQGFGLEGFYTTIDPNNTKFPHWSEINGCKRGTTHSCTGKSEYNGCDGHYNAKGHSVLVDDIIPQFRQIMGW